MLGVCGGTGRTHQLRRRHPVREGGVSAVRCGERGGGRAGGITYSCVAAIAEDFEAGLGGEGLAAGNDAVGAVDDRAAGGEAGESGAGRERHSAGNWGAGGSRGCGAAVSALWCGCVRAGSRHAGSADTRVTGCDAAETPHLFRNISPARDIHPHATIPCRDSRHSYSTPPTARTTCTHALSSTQLYSISPYRVVGEETLNRSTIPQTTM